MADQLNAGLVVFYLVAGVVSLVVVIAMLRPIWQPLWNLFRRTQQFLEDWFGEPGRPAEGIEERPGAMARLAQLERNSGSTMRDAIHRIEEEIGEVRAAAEQAVTAAGLAVSEAKVGRAVTAEAAERNRANISELRGAVAGLASALEHDENERRIKEHAYIAALNKIGVPLLPIADELEGGHT